MRKPAENTYTSQYDGKWSSPRQRMVPRCKVHQVQRGAIPTVHVEDVIVVGLAHGVGRHAAVGAVVRLVEVLDVQVGAGDHGVRWHILVDPQPVDLMGTGEHKYHTHQSAAVFPRLESGNKGQMGDFLRRTIGRACLMMFFFIEHANNC